MSRKNGNAEDKPLAPQHERAGGAGEARRWPLARVVLLMGGLLLAFGLGVALWKQETARRAPPPVPSETASTVGGPFQLVDQNGRAANESLLKGRWSAMFFGYTFCPDVCPATLSSLRVVKDRLGDKSKDLQVVFVTIDPARDTAPQLKTYLASPSFPQPIVGLTGTPEQIAAMARAYKAYYAKRGTGPDYLMDHGSGVYLIGPDGKFRTLISNAAGLDGMAAQLSDAMGRG